MGCQIRLLGAASRFPRVQRAQAYKTLTRALSKPQLRRVKLNRLTANHVRRSVTCLHGRRTAFLTGCGPLSRYRSLNNAALRLASPLSPASSHRCR